MATIIKNGRVFFRGSFINANVIVEGERITHIGDGHGCGEVIDAAGSYIIPGFIDIHIHGSNGCDFCDGTTEALDTMADYLVSQGVTGFLGTSMAYDEEHLTKAFTAAKEYMSSTHSKKAVMHGINMEGPFFSKKRKGAQAEEYIINPDIEMFLRLFKASGESVKLVDLAPELEGALDFIKTAAKYCTVSIAHTDADYATAAAAYQAGARHLTHLFNAMPTFTHRAPAVIGAAIDYTGCAELICDGFHIDPAAVRAAYKMFGSERICLISDSMRAGGMEDGESELGGQKVYVKEGKATLHDGTLAGSVTVLSECVRRAITFGIAPEAAILSATAVPAKQIGVWDQVGSIETGKYADLVWLNQGFGVERVMMRGELI